MEMAGSRSCGGRAFQDNGLDEENAREPNVDVDARGTNIAQHPLPLPRHNGRRKGEKINEKKKRKPLYTNTI